MFLLPRPRPADCEWKLRKLRRHPTSTTLSSSKHSPHNPSCIDIPSNSIENNTYHHYLPITHRTKRRRRRRTGSNLSARYTDRNSSRPPRASRRTAHHGRHNPPRCDIRVLQLHDEIHVQRARNQHQDGAEDGCAARAADRCRTAVRRRQERDGGERVGNI